MRIILVPKVEEFFQRIQDPVDDDEEEEENENEEEVNRDEEEA